MDPEARNTPDAIRKAIELQDAATALMNLLRQYCADPPEEGLIDLVADPTVAQRLAAALTRLETALGCSAPPPPQHDTAYPCRHCGETPRVTIVGDKTNTVHEAVVGCRCSWERVPVHAFPSTPHSPDKAKDMAIAEAVRLWNHEVGKAPDLTPEPPAPTSCRGACGWWLFEAFAQSHERRAEPMQSAWVFPSGGQAPAGYTYDPDSVLRWVRGEKA